MESFWDWYWNRPSLVTVTADGPIAAWTWHTAVTVVGGVPGWGLAPVPEDHPIPVLTALEPAAVVAGSADLAVTLHGSGFIPDSIVFADGSPLSVTGQTDTQLTVIVPAADLIQTGAVNMWVENPPPGGGTSVTLALAVVPGVPAITALNPAQVPAGSTGVTLRVDGGPLHADSVITLDGALLSTTYHAGSPAFLTAALPDGSLTLPGPRGVTVINPGLGGGESAPAVLTVTAGIPSLVALDPAEIPAGSAGVVLRADGGPLYPDSVIRANGADLATTFHAGSPAYLTAVLPDALTAATGVLSITAVNVGPGGGESAPLECLVTAGMPAITALDPAAVPAGSTGVTLRIDGGPFHADSVVTLDGAVLPTEYHPGDPVWLTAAVPAAATALPGLRAVTVVNPGLGGGESAPATFTVLAGVPVLTALDPAEIPVGSTGVVLGVQGAPFYPGSIIRVDGTELATVYHDGSPALLTAVLPDALLAVSGNLPVTVVNAGPGGGESAPAMLAITGGTERPVITLLTPAQVAAGSTGVELFVYGRPLDAAGNRIAVTDANGHTTAFTYDALNRLLTETDPLGRVRGQSYDAAGRLLTTTDAEGQTITFTHDDAGRLISKNYPDATQETYVYDASGNLLNATNPAVSMSYTYDARNLQLTISHDTIGKTVGYTYDERGRKVALTYPDGETITYTRDSRGQVARLASDRPGPGGEPPPSVDYAYNPDGSLASMDYGFGMHVERLYDRAGRLVDLRYTKPDGTVISDFAYTHDEAGNILSKTTDFGLVQYGYDALDRLVLADYDWKADETFAYDAVGNRTADAEHPVWHYDAANQLLAYGAGPHDPAGQTPPTVPAFTFAYDANGSTVSKTDLASGTTDQYGYSFDNRMSEVRRDGELVARYFYDHSSQRIRKDLFTGGSPTGSTWFVFGHEGLLAEYDTAGALIRKYAWQPDRPWNTDPLWQQEQDGNSFFYISDHIFTPQKITSASCWAVWQGDWLAFGEVVETIVSVSNSWRFAGQYTDTESGYYYNRHRVYSKELGIYLQIDPYFSNRIEALNTYVFGLSNPIMYYDNLGLFDSRWEWGYPGDSADCWGGRLTWRPDYGFGHYDCNKGDKAVFVVCWAGVYRDRVQRRAIEDESLDIKAKCLEGGKGRYMKGWLGGEYHVRSGGISRGQRKFKNFLICCETCKSNVPKSFILGPWREGFGYR